MDHCRRTFLRSAGQLGIGGLLLRSLAAEEVLAQSAKPPPRRLLVIHVPSGRVPEAWTPTGNTQRFELGPSLKPYADARLNEQLTVVDGASSYRSPDNPGDNHGGAMCSLLTGGKPIQSQQFKTPVADRISLDQMLAADARFVGETPYRSLQLAADTRADRDDLYHKVLSYAGRARPLPPQAEPQAVFDLLFGDVKGGSGAPADPAQLARLRADKRSVLDFLAKDLARLRQRAPNAQRAKLDAHLEAIRTLEMRVAELTPRPTFGQDSNCSQVSSLGSHVAQLATSTDEHSHRELGQAQLEMVRLAFACGLSRIATFSWAPGTSHVSFQRTAGDPNGHHKLSHGSNFVALAKIDRWYSEQNAAAIQALAQTPDGAGSLLDHTLVVITSEMARGMHAYDGHPLLVLGGRTAGHRGGRWLRLLHAPYLNDFWWSVGRALGLTLDGFGDPELYTQPVTGLFAA